MKVVIKQGGIVLSQKVSAHVIYLALLMIASFAQSGTTFFRFGQTLDRMMVDDFKQV